jgi:sulfur-oxidizing protein SoxY
MPSNRRKFIQQSLALSVSTGLMVGGLLQTSRGQAAWSEQNFARSSLTETLNRLYNDAILTETDQIMLKLPKTAENGAVVPITITSTLPKVTNIDIFVAKNPTPLAAQFKLSPDMAPFVSARIKMAETCNVIAVITSEGKLFKAKQEVQVTIGGCGG